MQPYLLRYCGYLQLEKLTMYFRLSNTAEGNIIEDWTQAAFKYPDLYKPQTIINGLDEVTIPIITLDEPNILSLAIWGILPATYDGDWRIFQNTTNTLNIYKENLDTYLWYSDAVSARRSVIPVTGYFTSYLKNGCLITYRITRLDEKPFYLAGIYNTLEDGFITSSIIVGDADGFIKKYQNIVPCMPLRINETLKDLWLNKTTPLAIIKQLLNSSNTDDFKATQVKNETTNSSSTSEITLDSFPYSAFRNN